MKKIVCNFFGVVVFVLCVLILQVCGDGLFDLLLVKVFVVLLLVVVVFVCVVLYWMLVVGDMW